ncbi:MAG: hypothetical protein FWE23_07575 [Chitinivibrionia bacterium]|jgi:hypothetical protein|nr:hypothetical protein [Chitinivibrionia bacterium]
MRKIAFVVCIVCALFLSSAMAITFPLRHSNAEIDNFIRQNPDLPDFDRSALMSGEFQIGIRTETLRFMFGSPRRIDTVRQPWAVQEMWHYRVDRNRLMFIIENGGVVGIERQN